MILVDVNILLYAVNDASSMPPPGNGSIAN